jgi:CRISPR/Cas system-associated endoribonuclease Cas2
MILSRRRVLVLYDVDRMRVNDVRNFLDSYLCWKNIEGRWEMGTWEIGWGKKFAYEGELTAPQFKEVIVGLKKIIDHKKDGVLLLFRKIGPEKEGVIKVSRVRSVDNQVLESNEISVGKMPVPLWLQGIGAWEEKDTLYKVFSYFTWRCAMLSLGLG